MLFLAVVLAVFVQAAGTGAKNTAGTDVLVADSKFAKNEFESFVKENKLDTVLPTLGAVDTRLGAVENDYLKKANENILNGKIAAAEHKAATNLEAAVKRISAIESEALLGKINGLKEQYEQKVASIEGTAALLQTQVNNLSDSVTQNEKKAAENAAETKKVAADLVQLSARVDTNDADYKKLVQCSVVAPENGKAGKCGTFLDPNKECEPDCNAGFDRKGKTSCAIQTKVGKISTAQCIPQTCSEFSLPTGVIGNGESGKACPKSVTLTIVDNQCEMECDVGFTGKGSGSDSGTLKCEMVEGKLTLTGKEFTCEKAAEPTKEEAANKDSDGDEQGGDEQGGDEQGGDEQGGDTSEVSLAKNNWPEASAEQWVAQPQMLSLESDFNGWKFSFCLLAAFNLGMATMYCYGKKEQASHARTPLLP